MADKALNDEDLVEYEEEDVAEPVQGAAGVKELKK